ncbi:YCF48-related protein [Flavobacterium sp.]|uniref:YCF48-related protein n=1 Tax=Flavobacterium sp. TaxID=239 RepID=UPI0026178599|nr:YCF48-related protein [Flavobacterium sp.]MDD3004197.1 YCF48-related protein [Flavobacterium sp.]
MKKHIFLTLLFGSFYCQGQNWKVITPFNNANTITDMEVTANGSLYVIAQLPDSMHKSTDGGNSWSAFPITLNYPSDLEMINDNLGYAISTSGNVIKTTDGWQTATNINYGGNSIHDRLFFLNENMGFIAGYRRFLKMTLDGGITWTGISIPTTLMSSGEDVTDIEFVNANVGFVVTSNGNVLKTTDQCLTWTKIELQSSGYQIEELKFVNENIGFAVGPLGQIYRTSDQGLTWVLTDTDAGILYDIRLIDGTLYAVGSSRSLVTSSDMGVSWSPVKTVSYETGGSSFTRMYTVSKLNGQIIVAGENGEIYKATNASSTTWASLYKPIFGGMVTTGFQFANTNQGIMVGAGTTQSSIYYTENGGYQWERKAIAGSNFYKSLDVKSDGKALVTGSAGYVTTANFGQTWTTILPIQVNTSYTKCWLKNNNDFFVGTNPGAPINDGLIKKTGVNTFTQFIDMPRIGEINFLNENIGYAGTVVANYPGSLWKTVDGGATWTILDNYFGGNVAEIQIINENKLYIKTLGGSTLVSNDGGISWTVLYNYPTKFHFFDELNGYGIDTNTKHIYKTENAGIIWEIIIENDNSLCGMQHFAWFPDKIIYSGAQFKVCILNIDQLLQVNPVQNRQTNKVRVYPNPTRDFLNFSEYMTTVTISDITGKVLASFEYLNKLDISNFENGVYIISLTSENGLRNSYKIIKQ